VAVQEIWRDKQRDGVVRLRLNSKATLIIGVVAELVLGEVGAFMGPCVRLPVSCCTFSIYITSWEV
jgi:hypothetical protein